MEIANQVNRTEELLTVIARALLAPIVEKELQDAKFAKLYSMTGDVTADQACKKLGLSKTTVIEAWSRWARLGLVIKDGRKFRKSL